MELYLDSRVRPHRVPTAFILKLAAVALRKNYFKFEDSLYMQAKGTAMGCPYAPEMAVFFMAQFEERFLANNNPLTSI